MSTKYYGTDSSVTQTINANNQYYDYTSSLGTISGTGRKIGDFINENSNS